MAWGDKNWEKEDENQEKTGKKRVKIRKKRKNEKSSFTLPLLTNRAGYATDIASDMLQILYSCQFHFEKN